MNVTCLARIMSTEAVIYTSSLNSVVTVVTGRIHTQVHHFQCADDNTFS